MQTLYKNKDKDKRDNNRRADSMNAIICVGRVSWYLEEKYFGEFRSRNTRICNSRGIFGRFEERIQWRRWQNNEESGVVESRVGK